MADLTESELQAIKEGPLKVISRSSKGAYGAYWFWNIFLTTLSIGASTTTSVLVSNTAIKVNTYWLAAVSWAATVASLVVTSFGIKENKDRWEKISDGLTVEEAFLAAKCGPYALTTEPRRLYVARVAQMFQGSNPSTPPLPPAETSPSNAGDNNRPLDPANANRQGVAESNNTLPDPGISGKYELRLMSWGDGSEVPTSDKNLVVLGTDDDGLLHLRIFDAAGTRTTDTDETQRSDHALLINALKTRLPGLLPPYKLTDAEKEEVIAQARSIAGQTP